MRKLFDGRSIRQRLFANSQKTVVAIAINEFRVLVNLVRLTDQMPDGRRKRNDVVNLGAAVGLLLRARAGGETLGAYRQKRK